MGEIYSGYRQKKKIPGQRVTDLCVDSMYPLVPQTLLALKTGAQARLFCTSVGSHDYSFPQLYLEGAIETDFHTVHFFCCFPTVFVTSMKAVMIFHPFLHIFPAMDMGTGSCVQVSPGREPSTTMTSPPAPWSLIHWTMGIGDLTGRACSLLGPLFPGAMRVPGLRQDSEPLLAGGCFPGLWWPGAFGSFLRTACN